MILVFPSLLPFFLSHSPSCPSFAEMYLYLSMSLSLSLLISQDLEIRNFDIWGQEQNDVLAQEKKKN